jgi:phosphoribosyl 1,2-cyclic phosphate phosphodiesterase
MYSTQQDKTLKITLLGTGTSQGVPVIGCDCAVCRSTNLRDKRLRVSCLITTDDTQILIDVGPDFRQQMLKHGIKNLDAILITHEHNDHTAGLDDVRSFNFRQNFDMPIFVLPRVYDDLRQRFAYTFAEKRYPGAPAFDWNIIAYDKVFKIKNLSITPIEVMHGDLPIAGFRIGNFAYLTDAKTISEAALSKLQHLDTLVISALHHQQHHSHLNIKEAIDLVEQIKPKQTFFTHLSHHVGLHEEVIKTLPPNITLAYDDLSFEVAGCHNS